MIEFPLYMKVGDVFVPIGMAEVHPTSEHHVQISGDLDAFPGTRLTFSRIVNWEEFITYTRSLYPDGFIMTNPEGNGHDGPTEDEKQRIKDRILKELEKQQEDKKKENGNGS